ncbi:DUF2141 domain-containing protein [Telluribacter sp. SYSU D00476]|uniref:DUF2141 domain-containing protein n=1 Tax=Telluribacter sp. SYSU D00476 TaxID=2811430 RepID=UPI001FF5A4BF|nr:DUF2141 domain-containing protein [Telluribacter sp. SYSU D00476]
MSTLTVEITNVKRSGGKLRLAVFRPTDKFGSGKPYLYKIVSIEKPEVQRVDFELAPGQYAVAVYHDVNSNDKLDKNLVGYPSEPFGFSNNYRPVVSAPKFKDCSFEVGTATKQISIRLLD